MKIEPHPLKQLQPQHVATIREFSAAAEKAGKLLPEQLALAYEQQWFKVLVPKVYGGGQLSLPDEVRLIEALTCADGSFGWAITLCCGAGWFGGFLDPTLCHKIFAEHDVCLAGSGAPNGTAVIDGDGYRISGTWKYASGALHATHFTANCVTQLPDGGTQVLPFIFDKKDVTVHPAWNYTGMVATGSHSFEVNNLLVGRDRCFKIDPNFAIITDPLYQYPFHQLAEATLAVNISGLAISFIDQAAEVFVEKRKRKDLTQPQLDELQNVFDRSVTTMNTLRTIFYEAVDASWLDYENNSADPKPNLIRVSVESRKLAKAAIKMVDELYPYCGLIAASNTSVINRIWRDIHTASQHSLLTFDE